ncbi:MAG: ATP-binding protein [Steroidobacteraceae bacterium]|nr:ATP-binding protein [Steroidobacteraceae bacterium]
MHRNNLHLRLVLAALLPLLIAMVAAWAIAALTFARTLEQRVADQLADAADTLAETGLPYTPEVLQRVADLQGARIALLDRRGAMVTRTAGDIPAGVVSAASDMLDRNATTGGMRRLDVAGEPVVVVARPVATQRDARASAILLVGSLRDARTAASRAALGMGLAVLAAGVLLVTLQYLLMRSITQPMSRLATMARDIAAGRRDVRAAPVALGELQSLATALNDLTTKLGAYESELAERSRLAALGEMSARIAHEIRNPLTGLKLHLQMLGERTRDEDAATVQRLLDEVKRLELIVASSLSLTRTQPAQLRADDANLALEEVLQLMEPSLRHHRIVLERDLAPLPATRIDRDRLKQALLNLVVNAADALPDGGTIAARSVHYPVHQRVALSIEDSGPGLPPEPLDPATSSKPFGLGLGLRVCREIVAEHDGTLELGRSASLGGARVTISLPDCAPA